MNILKVEDYHKRSDIWMAVVQLLSSVQLFATQWIVARQAPFSIEFSRLEHWSGKPFLPSGDLPDPGIKPGSLALRAESLLSEPPGKALKP